MFHRGILCVMHIGIDGNEANVGQRVGIGQFAYQVLKQLYHLQTWDRYTVMLKRDPGALQTLEERADWRYRVFGPHQFWTQLALPLRLYRSESRPDIFFSPTHYGPRWSPVPTVISVMDLSFIFFPDQFRFRDLYQLRSWTERSVRKARRIITISQSSKHDILHYYGVEPGRVVVAYPGYDVGRYYPKIRDDQNKLEQMRQSYGLTGRYIITIGTLQPRKNHQGLIKAFSRLLKDFPDETDDLSLVIVGKRGWLEDRILTQAAELGIKDRVLFPGFVPDVELPYLLAGASAFGLLSFYEGFGIPVLEAQAVGVPCVISDRSSLPEVGGSAALYVDPEDREAVSIKLAEILRDVDLRDRLRAAGYENVKRFSWRSCAETVYDVLIRNG